VSPKLRALFIVPVIIILFGFTALAQEWNPFASLDGRSHEAHPPSYGMVRREIADQPVILEAETPAVEITVTVTATAVSTGKGVAADFTPTPLPELIETTPVTPTVSPEVYALQLKVFEELWETVRENYLYTDYNGIDWQATHNEYLQKLGSGLSDDVFYTALQEMVYLLGDDHSVYLSPQDVAEEEAQFSGNQNFVGVGFLLSPVPERQRATVLLTFPGSPAEEGGISSRDSVLAVDGQPVLDENDRIRNIIRGPEGTPVMLTIQTPGGEPRDLTLVRRRITGPIPVPYKVITGPGGQRVGYILLVTLADGTADDQVQAALEAMNAEAHLDGLIIDNRQNEGGTDTVLRGILAYFTGGQLGSFTSRAAERPLHVWPEDVSGSQDLPLVVLVGPNTVSYGEVMSGVLQDSGRAYLIGETTDGNVETLLGYNFSDGSRAWIAHDSFRPQFHPEQDWEKNGIQPDLIVTANWDEFTLETDPVILAATEHLFPGAGLEK